MQALGELHMRHGAKQFRLTRPSLEGAHALRAESDLHEYLKVFMHPRDVVMDLAPEYGRGAIFFAGVLDCRVIAVPEDETSQELLHRNVEANGMSQSVEVLAAATHASGNVVVPTGRLALLKIGAKAAASADALLEALVRDRGVLLCAGLESDASSSIASRLARHSYTTLAVFDDARHFVFVPVATTEEVARFTQFVRSCPSFGGGTTQGGASTGDDGAQGVSIPPGSRRDTLPQEQQAAGAPPAAPIDESMLADLQGQIARLEARMRQQSEAQRVETSQLASELRMRVGRVEQKHEALLNGRIFGSLRAIANVLRKLNPTRAIAAFKAESESRVIVAGAGSKVVVAPPKPAAPAEPPPEKLPSPERVPISGVSYMSRPQGGVSGAEVVYAGEPLITVVMTTYNTAEFVESAVRSILNQTWRNLELIIIDDCSSDDTRKKIEALQAVDSRIKLYCFGENRGTYWCKNFGITKSSGSVITFMDSDDISEPRRLERQFAALNHPGYAVSTCNHVRKDESGEVILINGVAERVAYISQMVKRKVFEEVGYFDTIRTSADDEFLRRVRITYGQQAHVNVKEVLYIALLRDGSLTRDPANAINFVQQRNSSQSFLSPQRRHYAAMCDRWHKFLQEKSLRPYMPFPVVRRPFPVFGKLVVDAGHYDGNQISACMATYPPREEKLRDVVASLLPQVDRIYVYLNEYSEVPSFLRHSRITTVIGKQDLRDNGKFFFSNEVPRGYCFTVDDDIAYPPDYVQAMIRKLEFYERKAVVGLHGTVYAKPVRSFFKGRTLLHFEESLGVDTVVNQLGTGTVAFHTDLWRPELKWFETTGMADVWLAVHARQLRIPLISVARDAQWLQPIGAEETTLFREFRKNDELQTNLVRGLAPWKEELSNALSASVKAKRTKYGSAYASLLPRLGVAPDAPRA
ncbi:glycosyltransferase family 2 protein [Lysobacter niabensis]|uniref:glycosyltransferase family 2 protein n=1 Tax=Agrilutibacter niabensis TaxID=380628 RepID=UPI003619CAB1